MIQELMQMYGSSLYGILLRIAVTIAVGVTVLWLLRKWLKKWLSAHATHHITSVATAFVWYGGISLIAISIMHELGFHFSTLLGAAGIIGIAIGFAAQTSVSNIISGIFLLVEHSFEVGDYIEYEKVAGVVESIGLLSVNMRTLDNILVRIPNEMLLKNIFINTTAFSSRRLRFLVRIPSSQSIEAAKQIINDAIDHSSLLLKKTDNHCNVTIKNPSERVVLDGTTNWSSELMVRVWVNKYDVIIASEQLIAEIKKRADAAQIPMAISRLANID